MAKYSEIDVECGPVTAIHIYEEDCKTLSTTFKNADNAIASLLDGFYYLSLQDETTPKSNKFCLGVATATHTITEPNLEFALEADCKNVLSKL